MKIRICCTKDFIGHFIVIFRAETIYEHQRTLYQFLFNASVLVDEHRFQEFPLKYTLQFLCLSVVKKALELSNTSIERILQAILL